LNGKKAKKIASREVVRFPRRFNGWRDEETKMDDLRNMRAGRNWQS
jgi:hypothetical protein